jgi:tyrosyl-tRNA synthetase
MYAKKFMPKLGYKKGIYFMTPMAEGLRTEPKEPNELTENDESKDKKDNIQDNKMSSSNLNSKIDLLDTKKQISKKIGRAFCAPGNIEDNTVLSLLKSVVIPVLNHMGIDSYLLSRSEEYGGNVMYNSFQQIKDDFENEILHPGDLKNLVSSHLNIMLDPIRQKFTDEKSQHVIKMAYDDKYFKKQQKIKQKEQNK